MSATTRTTSAVERGTSSGQGPARGSDAEVGDAEADHVAPPLFVLSGAPASHRELAAWLDDGERDRLERLRRLEDRDRMATSRALLKSLVAALSGVRAAQVRLDYTCTRCGRPHGRPVVVAPTEAVGVHVSLSHAGARVVVAATTAGPVGVDVEPAEAGSFPGFADIALTDAEAAWVGCAPVDRRSRLLTTYWVRKESVLKATGHGLSVPATTVEVTPPDSPPEVVTWHGMQTPSTPVRLHDFDVGALHVGCAAVLSPVAPVLRLLSDVSVQTEP